MKSVTDFTCFENLLKQQVKMARIAERGYIPSLRTIFSKRLARSMVHRYIRARQLRWRSVFCSVVWLALLSSIIYGVISLRCSYLSFVIFGMKMSFRDRSPSSLITWEIPDFAFYNNQLLLHFGTIAYMPSETEFVSPGFRLPPLRGMNASYPAVSDLFDGTRLQEVHVFDRQAFRGKRLRVIRTPSVRIALDLLSNGSDMDTTSKTIIDVRNRHDGM